MSDDSKEADMARRLARAEAAVADLAKSYISWAMADVDRCTELLAAARVATNGVVTGGAATGGMATNGAATNGAARNGAADAMSGGDRMIATQALHAVAHNIKGQGSSFGFQLMTRLGNSLCRLTRPKRFFPDADLNLVAAHLDAMRLVLTQEIRGDGGAPGERLAQRLETLVAQALGPEADGATVDVIR